MKITRAVGLGLIIILLQFLIPQLFRGFEEAALAFFSLTQTTFKVSETAMVHGIALPQIPY